MSNRIVARTDKLGTRPVYWSTATGKLVWSHTLDDFDTEPDRLGVFQSLTVGFPIGRRSLLRDVHTLPPGHELVEISGCIEAQPYWTPPQRHTHRRLSESVEAISTAFDTFCQRLDGQRVGLGLSGGKDSRVILNALIRNKVRVTCLSWPDHDFNDRIVCQLAAMVNRPHSVVRADEEDTPGLRDITASLTGGIYRYAIGFPLLGRECQRLGLSSLLTGFSGERLSGLIPRKDRNVEALADRMLRKQMELYSFAEAEKLLAGNGQHTEQTIFEWRESFREQEWRGDLGDVCLWQVLWNRNYKRIVPLLLPASYYCEVIQPYLDDSVLNCYLSLPVEHLTHQVAHCRAAYWGKPKFGNLPSTSFHLPLKWEPALGPVIDLARELKTRIPIVAKVLVRGGVSDDRRKQVTMEVIEQFCEKHTARLV